MEWADGMRIKDEIVDEMLTLTKTSNKLSTVLDQIHTEIKEFPLKKKGVPKARSWGGRGCSSALGDITSSAP